MSQIRKYFAGKLRYVSSVAQVVIDFYILKSQLRGRDASVSWKNRKLIFNERTEITQYDRHYILHTAWAARKLKQIDPDVHVDISSILYFAGIVSAFYKIQFYDYRPAKIAINNLFAGKQDLSRLTFEDGSVKSLSCMHTIEHIGLGRYGDPIDHEGDRKAIQELSRVLSFDGDLLIVVPVAAQSKLVYNAHRIYNPDDLIKLFSNYGLEIEEFALIPDSHTQGDIVVNPSADLIASQKYGCGCFWLKKVTNQLKNETSS